MAKLFLPRGANSLDLGPSFVSEICLGWGPRLVPQLLPLFLDMADLFIRFSNPFSIFCFQLSKSGTSTVENLDNSVVASGFGSGIGSISTG